MPGGEDPFLSVQGKMIAVLADQHLGQETRRGQAAIQKPLRQGGNEWCPVTVRPVDVLRADHTAAQKASRFVIELFTDFLPDPSPFQRCGLHGFGLDHFLHHRQVLWQTLSAFLPWSGSGGRGRWFCFGLRSGALGLSQHQFKLIRRDSFTGGTEQTLDDQVQFLTEENVLPGNPTIFSVKSR